MGLPAARRRYAVVATRGRPVELGRCVAAALAQVDLVIVVDNNDQPEVTSAERVLVVWAAEQPPNLSRLWNIGLTQAAGDAHRNESETWDVAVLNDDAIIPPGWVSTIAGLMRRYGCYAGSSGVEGLGRHHINRTPGTTRLMLRMQGFAFVLNGESGLRADERLRWWCGDNDLDMQARALGGTILVPGVEVEHLYPDQSTRGELATQTAVDMQTFVDKWGWRPW